MLSDRHPSLVVHNRDTRPCGLSCHATGIFCILNSPFRNLCPAFVPRGGGTTCDRSRSPCFHQKMAPKTQIKSWNHAVEDHSWRPILIVRWPCSHSSHTSKKRLGLSVHTPSRPLRMVNRIRSSSLTVQVYTGLPLRRTSLRKRDPK